MDSKALRRISGAWSDRDHTGFMKLAVKAEYDLSIVTPRTRKAVIKGLRTGVLGTTSGMAASVFAVASNSFGLKYTCASEGGSSFYTNFYHETFRDSVVAIIALQSKAKDPGRYVYAGDRFIRSHSWHGGLTLLRQVYEDTVGVDDKSLREKAIDFLSAGGKFTHTWIDNWSR